MSLALAKQALYPISQLLKIVSIYDKMFIKEVIDKVSKLFIVSQLMSSLLQAQYKRSLYKQRRTESEHITTA